ncbi:hypothetical protein CPC1998_0299A, partial [Chlamydia psittaci C19/98]
MYCIKAK